MTQLISKYYLMDHVIDVLVNGTYEEAVLLEDIYDAPVQDEKDGIIRYKLSKPIEYIELVYTDKEVTKLSYDSNVTLVTPKAEPSETHEIHTETHECVKETHDSDLISRVDAIKAIQKYICNNDMGDDGDIGMDAGLELAIDEIKSLPSADIPTEDYSDLPDIPRAYYEKIVGNMSHEINMLKEQLESADAVPHKVIANIKVDTDEIIKRIKEEYAFKDEVVQCKDCEYGKRSESNKTHITCTVDNTPWFIDDFCSRAKIKGGDGE